MRMNIRCVDDPCFTAANAQILQMLLSMRQVAQHLQYRMLIEMNNGTSITIPRLHIDPDLV